MEQNIQKYQNAVDIIKTAILQSQARAAKAVNQEQLALYFGIGRYVSANTRKKNWGNGAIESISRQLRLPKFPLTTKFANCNWQICLISH